MRLENKVLAYKFDGHFVVTYENGRGRYAEIFDSMPVALAAGLKRLGYKVPKFRSSNEQRQVVIIDDICNCSLTGACSCRSRKDIKDIEFGGDSDEFS